MDKKILTKCDVRIFKSTTSDLNHYFREIFRNMRIKNEVVITSHLSLKGVLENLKTELCSDSNGGDFLAVCVEGIERMEIKGMKDTKTGGPFEVYVMKLRRHPAIEGKDGR